MLDNDNISRLIDLGLSLNQAKVYLSLVKLGISSAKSVWKYSGVSREEVYRKLNELQKMCYVERVFIKPAKFRAAPLECVISDMLKIKADELSQLQLEAEALRSNFLDNKEKNQIIHLPEFIFIPEGRTILERGNKALKTCKKSLDTICSWKKGLTWISNYHELFEAALNRNVNIRLIIEKTDDTEIPKVIRELKNNLLFQIKTVKMQPPACIVIFDQESLFLATSAKSSFVETPALWSNNSSMLGMAQIYFETIWKMALN